MQQAVLITGASGGIGQALCEAFAQQNYVVVATDIKTADINIQAKCKHYLQLDLVDFVTSVEVRNKFRLDVLKLLGNVRLKVVINNAAVQLLGSVAAVSADDFVQSLQVNLTAPFFLSQLFLEELAKNQNSSIINVGSIHSSLTLPGFVSYATSKTALLGLTQAMAVDLGNKIRVNLIQPAATQTEMLIAGFKGKAEELKMLSQVHPLGRIASPEEIAKAALFLASNDAAFISGAALRVDGGIGVRLHNPK